MHAILSHAKAVAKMRK